MTYVFLRDKAVSPLDFTNPGCLVKFFKQKWIYFLTIRLFKQLIQNLLLENYHHYTTSFEITIFTLAFCLTISPVLKVNVLI